MPAASAGALEVQLVRTVPERLYGGLPRGEFTILESYTRAFAAAQRFIYIESQFLWSPEIVQILAAKLRQPPRSDFRLVTLLPAHPNNGNDDTRGQLGVLADAAVRGGDEARFLACTLYQPRGAPVYVHAKVAIVDDRWLTVGSANLNEHSLFNDTEVNVACHDTGLAAAVRHRLWAEHLETDVATVAAADPTAMIEDVWRPTGEEQRRRRDVGAACTRRLVELPHASSRSRRLLGPIQGLLVDG
jgi:phosphatidylserine/phosphatidylglycerophosphate/cardiolipin synthase-like enzyme